MYARSHERVKRETIDRLPIAMQGEGCNAMQCELWSACLRCGVIAGLQPVLVHDPVGLPAVGRPPRVEDERLPHADEPAALLAVAHRLVPPGRLPEPRQRRPVRARPRRVLAVLVAEEVPVTLLLVTNLAVLFTSSHTELDVYIAVRSRGIITHI